MKCKHFERRAVKPPTRLEELLQLWRDVAIATAGSDNCVNDKTPNSFAIQVVGDYADFVHALHKRLEIKE